MVNIFLLVYNTAQSWAQFIYTVFLNQGIFIELSRVKMLNIY